MDWVGIDLYPQTWTSTTKRGPAAAAAAMREQLRRLRQVALPAARILAGSIFTSANGFPTGPGRDEAEQAELLTAAIEAVADVRRPYGIGLSLVRPARDSNSSQSTFEAQYGVLRDDYTPKPAFHHLRDLVGRIGR